tara:strand:+ start:8008 stop:8199 length:192 start_codon:yes stop_codon:yes gene_type:complete
MTPITRAQFEDILFDPLLVLKECSRMCKKVYTTRLVIDKTTVAVRTIKGSHTTYMAIDKDKEV